MALKDCPECGHQVSDRAETCPSCGIRLTDQLARTEYGAELARIDLKWERERQTYMVQLGRSRFLPKKRDAVIGTAFIVIICVGLSTWIVLSDGVKSLGGAVGLSGIGLLVGLGYCIYLHSKASDYEDAEAGYRLSREAAFSRYKTAAQAPGRVSDDLATPQDPPVSGSFPCPACGTSREGDLADCDDCGWRRAPP